MNKNLSLNDQFAPWVIRVVFGTNFIVIMLILGDLAFGLKNYYITTLLKIWN